MFFKNAKINKSFEFSIFYLKKCYSTRSVKRLIIL